MTPTSTPASPVAPSTDTTRKWTWILDEAAIRNDGGAADLAVDVDADVASQYAYAPPDAAYERMLWEATRTPDASPSSSLQVAASAGWIVSRAAATQPVFIAHTMLSAVWLLRQSLPADAVDEAAWAQPTQATCSVELVPTPSTPGEASLRPAKRARTASAADSDGTPNNEIVGERAVATVSNHNRRAELARKARQIKAAGRRMEALGLVDPGSQAPVVERDAHRSISPQDEPTVAWIVKQPAGLDDFFHTTKLPFATATTMLRCARSIGDETAKMHAAYFVQNWRRSGHPLLLQGTSAGALLPSSASSTTAEKSSFQITMDAISSSESVLATAGIVYRWAMARLGQRSQEDIERIQAADQAAGLHGRRRDGEGHVRAQAKNAILEGEKPRMSWSAFNARLKRSRRWFQAAKTLGWGFLVLIPTATITPHRAEQTLRIAEWDIWLRLVERVNPAAVQACRDFEAWAGPAALQNGSIQDAKRLRLEQRLDLRIHEVPDIDSNSDSDSDSGGSAGGSAPSKAASPSPGSHEHAARHTAVPHSLDLRELFRPVGSGDLASGSAGKQ